MKKITLLAALLFAGSFAADAQVLASENFDTALDWTVTHVSGGSTSLGWSQVDEGTNPTCLPAAGAGMAQFESDNIAVGNNYSLRSPLLTFSGGSYRVKFSMYRNSENADAQDKIRVFFNTTTAAGGTQLGLIFRATSLAPAVEANGWYDYAFNLPANLTGTGYVSFMGTSSLGSKIFLDEISVVTVQNDDAHMVSTSIPSVSATLGDTAIAGSLENSGANILTSFDLKWQIDSGTIHTQNVTGVNIAPAATYNFSHADLWNAVPGQHNLTVWIENPNGNADSDPTNDSITKSFFVLNEIFPKTVVYEEATGTWCGWCVRGHIGLKDMDHYHPDGTWIGIAVHNQDPMVLNAYDSAMANFISGYPSGTLNRIAGEVDPGLSTLEPAYQAELSKIPFAKVDVVNQTWDPVTRQISFDAQSVFALDVANTNYNLSAIIVENGVTGTTSTWRQHNYYTGETITDWTGFNWGTYPDYIPAATMIYNHVGRALLGGFNGVNGSVPTSVTYNVPNNFNFTYTLPAAQNAENIEIVVMLLDKTTGQIANAKEVELNTTLGTASFNGKKYGIYPNPTTGIFHINAPSAVNVSVVDVLGKTVFTANNVTRDTNVDLSGLQKGVYMAKISGDNGTATEKIVLN